MGPEREERDERKMAGEDKILLKNPTQRTKKTKIIGYIEALATKQGLKLKGKKLN